MQSMTERLTALKFTEIGAVAKVLGGGSIGFDPNRRFQRPMKENFAAWIVATHPEALVEEAYATVTGQQAAQDATQATTTATATPPKAKPTAKAQEGAAEAAADDLTAALQRTLAGLLAGAKIGVDADEVGRIAEDKVTAKLADLKPMVDDAIAAGIKAAQLPRSVIVTVKDTSGEAKRDMGLCHRQFEQLLKLAATQLPGDQGRLNVWLTGPAGSGKTTAARQVSEALGLPFYFNGAVDTEYKLLGFTDAQGRVVSRPFREAFEKGGVYLFDEVDASMPSALLAFNAATANGTCDFPDGNIRRHKDCIIIAAANTFGGGATNDYVGRAKQDGAFLDRFVALDWGYDEALERALCGNDAWVAKVHRYRDAVKGLGIRHIVSPRASMFGAAMLANGFAEVDVIDMVIRKGLTDDQWQQVRTKVK